MRILIVGAGVIGTVYGAHLAAGHAISVLSPLQPLPGRLSRHSWSFIPMAPRSAGVD